MASTLIDVSPLSREHQAARVGNCNNTSGRLLLLIASLCALLLLLIACMPAVSQQLLPRLASLRFSELLAAVVGHAWQQQKQHRAGGGGLGWRRWKVSRFPVGPHGIVTDADALDGIKRFADLVGDAADREQVQAGLLKLGAAAKRRRLNIEADRIANHHRVEDVPDAYDMSQCVGIVYDVANFIGWTGLNVDALVRSCPPVPDDVSCAANIPGIIANLMWVIDLVAQIPEYCVEDWNASRGEECFVNMAYFFASGGDLAADGISITGDCNNSGNLTDLFPIHGGRRLFLEPKAAKLPASPRDMLSAQAMQNNTVDYERRYNQGLCSMAAMQIANDLVYTGIDFWQVILECADLRPESEQDVIDDCTGNIIGVISDIPALVTDIADIVSSCPVNEPDGVSCLADASDMVSTALGLGVWAATVEHSCNYSRAAEENDPDQSAGPIIYPVHAQAALR